MSLAEKIKASQEDVVKRKDELLTMTKSLEENPDCEQTLSQVEEMTEQLDSKVKTLAALEKAEKSLMAKAEPVNAPAIIHGRQKAQGSQEPIFVKNAVCNFLAHTQRKSVEEVMAERYGNDEALKTVREFQKSAVPLANTYTAGWAAELVQTDTQGFIDLLTPTSVAAALAGRGTSLNFSGYDSITIPRRAARGAAGTTLSGAFVAEGSPIPLGQMAVSSSKLSRFKMGIISTFSKELAERSTPAIEGLVRSAILSDTSMALDGAFMSATAEVTGVQPAGLLNGVTVGTGTAGGGVAAVLADIKTMLGALSAAGLGTRPVLIVNSQDALSIGLMQTALGEFVFRGELATGQLLGVEVIRSLNVAKGTCFMVDAESLATAFDMTSFDTSDVATVVESNSDAAAPTMAVNSTGVIGDPAQVPRDGGIAVSGSAGVGTVGFTSRSLWQTHSIGVKAVTPVSWGLMQPGSVVALDTLSW